MNHASRSPFHARLRRAGLAGDLDAGDLGRRPVPSSTTCFIISVTSAAVCVAERPVSGWLWRW